MSVVDGSLKKKKKIKIKQQGGRKILHPKKYGERYTEDKRRREKLVEYAPITTAKHGDRVSRVTRR